MSGKLHKTAPRPQRGEFGSLDALLDYVGKSREPILDLLRWCRHADFSRFWQTGPELYRLFGRKLVSADHPCRAYEVTREGLEIHRHDVDLSYRLSLALARSGNISKSREQVDKMLAPKSDWKLTPAQRIEVLSLKGRLYKDRFQRTANPEKRADSAKQSAHCYRQAWDESGDSFPGINAATMLLLAGETKAAQKLAGEVIECVWRDAQEEELSGNYWLGATLAEAHLIRGEQTEARTWYENAVAAAGTNRGDVSAMHRQVRMLSEVTEVDKEVQSVFAVGSVIVFAGHLIDHPERLKERQLDVRFPPDEQLERGVRLAIRRRLKELDARVGYCSVACGADILFAEEILRRPGTALHVVLPFALADFYKTSVDFALSDDPYWKKWRKRCDKVIARADGVHHATNEPFMADEQLFEYGNSVLQGLSIIRARRIGVDPVALCVLDPASVGKAGTAEFHSSWLNSGRPAEVIDLEAIREETLPRAKRAKTRGKRQKSDGAGFAGKRWKGRRLRRECRAMLFADVKNFSMLTDAQAPEFFATFLDRVSRVVNGPPIKSLFRNTWGDGLFIVFKDVLDCAELALTLLEEIGNVNWEKLGLPTDTTIRIGVHSGPVYRQMDKIIRRYNYFGAHVNRAARIEPVTTPGCVFASEQFAAELALLDQREYIVEYVGVEQLAKDFDRCTLYQLARRE